MVRAIKYIAGGIVVIAAVVLAALYLLPAEPVRFVNEGVAFANPLRIPPLATPRIENGEKIFDLAVAAGATEFVVGRPTQTLGFNGSVLGPTLRATKGDRVRIDVVNRLGETTTVHWHGMHLPPVMDGGPHQAIAPGATWQPHWTVINEAATLWYHPHTLHKTGEQVYRGLAGLFLIDDENSATLGLPAAYGVDDIPLIVQDRRFDAAGALVYDDGHDETSAPGLFDNPPGMLGDTILVNGTLGPYLDVPASLVRFRILNGSNARRYDFGFADDRAFVQIASDGGFLDHPVERTRLLLAPGERAEILVDFAKEAGPVVLMSYAVTDKVSAVTALLQRLLAPGNDENQQFRIVEFRPRPATAPSGRIPETLNAIARLDPDKAARTRLFTLEFTGRTINGKAMDHARIDEVVRRGDIELWDIRNDSIQYHPFHVHGVQFAVVSRNGQPPPPYERGWKDTVIVSPEETVGLVMRFADYADPTLPYMFHCHILEHEDMGMMGQFVVVDDVGATPRLDSPLVAAPVKHSGH